MKHARSTAANWFSVPSVSVCRAEQRALGKSIGVVLALVHRTGYVGLTAKAY
jgi:hypothetical protein